MKKVTLFIITLLSAANLQAAEFGLGATLNSDASTIYIPINITKEFRLEPFIMSYKQNQDETSYQDANNYRMNQYGLGLFKVKEAANNTNIFMGARIAYFSGDNGGKFNGYTLAPVIGFEYFPVKNFSLGADAAWEYSHITSNDYYSDEYITKSYRTKTSIAFKYYFN